jgi:hypothetical protein
MCASRKRSDLAVPPDHRLTWRGDEHNLRLQAASEVGLVRTEAAVDSYTQGFSAGITVEDPYDGAIVARGRTVLKHHELLRSLRTALAYLGVSRDASSLRVHDGKFELRVARHAAERSSPVLDAGKNTLRVWIGFGVLGLVAYQVLPTFLAAFVWSAGLLIGAWQLRRGLATGRAMLAARLAIALGVLAAEEQLILPPAEDDAPRIPEGS